MKTLVTFLFIFSISSVALANPGMNAFNRKDYNEAYRAWSKTPDTAESQYGLGVLHYEGLGGPKNMEKGLALLRSSSDKGFRLATEYLVNIYERSNDPRNTIRYLERLFITDRSLKVQERIVSAHRKLLKGQPEKSPEYCAAITELVKLGGATEIGLAEKCAINGLNSPVSIDTARKWFLGNFSRTPTIEGLELLAESTLNPRDASFNPSMIEEAIWILDPNLKNQIIKKVLLEKGKVSHDTCKTLPFREPEQRVRFSAYCTLAVIAGANLNPLLVSREYISGSQGRINQRSIQRGLTLLELNSEVSSSIDGVYLKLEAARLANNWERSLDLLQANESILTGQKSDRTHPEFMFLLEKANISSKLNDSRFDQNSAVKLSQILSRLTEEVDLKNIACKTLAPYVGENFTNPADLEKTTQRELQRSLDGLCTTAGISRPDPSLPPPSSFSSKPQAPPPNQVKPAPAVSAQPPQGVANSALQRPNQPPLAASSFDKSLFDCNQGKFDGCAPAAIAIMSPTPPSMYQNLPMDQRVAVAEKLLLMGANAGDTAAMAVLHDVYENGLDSSKRPEAQRFLNILLSKGDPSGFLRQEIRSLPKDPVTAVLGGTLLRNKYAATCEKIRQLRDGGQLTQYDRNVADDWYGGLMCRAVR